jgi:PadR family transcriptional regulator AphA
MARENKTRFAILGLIAQHPMSGYDIKRALEQRLKYFWRESYGQIYPMLSKLTGEKAVEKRTDENDGKPDRNVYSITPKGLSELRSWLENGDELFQIRHETILKVYFGDIAGAQTTRERLLALKEKSREQLKIYEEIELRFGRASEQDEPNYSLYTLRCGIHTTRSFIAWCDETISDLDKRAKGPEQEML